MFLPKIREKLLVGAAILFLPTLAKATCNSTSSSSDNNLGCSATASSLAVYDPAVTSWCRWSPTNAAGCSQIDVPFRRRNYGFSGAGCLAPITVDSGWLANGFTTAASTFSCS